MSSTINTNISSLTANRSLARSQGTLATSIQRLSSGLRVNSAKDDAAGLAIGERMTSQIRGSEVAARNANDGISLAQVAEGSTSTMTEILQRCRELAVQAANDTNSSSDRANLSQEVNQLLTEFSRISNVSEFNSQKLLDGSFKSKSFQVGANAGQTVDVSIPKLDISLGYYVQSSATSAVPLETELETNTKVSVSSIGYDSNPQPARNLTINNTVFPITLNEDAKSVASKINNSAIDVSAIAETKVTLEIGTQDGLFPSLTTLKLVAGEDYSKAVSVTFSIDSTNGMSMSDASAQAAMAAINAVSSQTGVSAVDFIPEVPGKHATFFRLSTSDGSNLHVLLEDSNSVAFLTDANWDSAGDPVGTGNGGLMAANGPATTFGVDDLFAYGAITLKSTEPLAVIGDGVAGVGGYGYFIDNAPNSTAHVTLDKVSLANHNAASKAIETLDSALTKVSSARANLGAVNSRFGSIISNLSISSENMSASRSRIMDADYAKETAELSRSQILNQAGLAMVAQANQTSQNILKLLSI